MRSINHTWLPLLLVVLTVACNSKNHNGVYVAKWRNEFSIAEDTIEIKDDIVIKRTGYHKIRNGQVKPKEWSVKRWTYNDPVSPIIEPGEGQITIGTTTYKQIK